MLSGCKAESPPLRDFYIRHPGGLWSRLSLGSSGIWPCVPPTKHNYANMVQFPDWYICSSEPFKTSKGERVGVRLPDPTRTGFEWKRLSKAPLAPYMSWPAMCITAQLFAAFRSFLLLCNCFTMRLKMCKGWPRVSFVNWPLTKKEPLSLKAKAPLLH